MFFKLSVVFLVLTGYVAVMAKPSPFVNGLVIPGIGTVYGYLPGYPQGYPQGNPWYYPQGNPEQYPQGNPGQYPEYPQGYPTNNSPGDTESFDPSTGPRNELPWAKGGATELDDLNKLIKRNQLIYVDGDHYD